MPEGAKFCTGCGAKVAEIETDEIHLNAAEQLKEESSASAPVEMVAEEAVAAAAAKMEKRKETLREKYLSFHGRLNRKRFILRYMLLMPLVILNVILIQGGFTERSVAINVFTYVIGLILWVVGTSLRIRRLHDSNLSGWLLVFIYILFLVIPEAVTQSTDICFMVIKGTEGDNKYGPDPLAK